MSALIPKLNPNFRPWEKITHSSMSIPALGHPSRSSSNPKLQFSPIISSLKLNLHGYIPWLVRKGQTHFIPHISSNGSVFTSPPAFELELGRLLALIPDRMRSILNGHPELEQLIEIVMDLGRKPLARFPSGDFIISTDTVTFQDLEHAISLVGDFADDNRAGIDRSLHRISAIRNRRGCIIGLTCRVGRAISGSAYMVRDLVEGGGSLLIIGRPGVGKTTVMRDIAKMLADNYKKRVVIVDSSNEIAGDGDIPHAGIGSARRMQVPNVDMQHKVMIEAVENHMPQTIVIDEIGTELEALAASTIAQRGIQLVGTAHGMTIENLIKNPSLEILVGGIQSVTLGDDEAFRRGVQKTILERKGPPAFTCAVEMISLTEWRVHHSLEATVDAVLAGRSPLFEVRKMGSSGVMVENSSTTTDANLRSNSCNTNEKHKEEVNRESDAQSENNDDNDYVSTFRSRVKQFRRDDNTPIRLYTYQIMEANLEQVLEVMGLEDAVDLVDDIGAADAILALHSKIKQNSWIREMAKFRQLPVFVIKANTTAQMVRAMRVILGMESFGTVSVSSSNRFKSENEIAEKAADRRNSSEETDALEEARLAIEQIVIPKGQPVELLPRSSEILALQMTVVEGYKLVAEKVGAELNKRLRILPLHASIKESITSDLNATEVQQTPVKDVDVCKITAGTTVARLPFLQD